MNQWVKRLGVELLKVESNHTAAVLDAYFKGIAPFRKIRHREDLPDGFILEATRSAASRLSNVRMVSADKRLHAATSCIPGVVAFKSLKEFFASTEVVALLHAANAADNLKALGSLLIARADGLKSRLTDLLTVMLIDFEIHSVAIPDSSQAANVSGVAEIDDIEFLVEEIEFLGRGTVLLPMKATSNAEASYLISKADYAVLNDQRSRSVSISDWNKHYFMAEEILTATIRAMVSVELPDIDLASQLLTKASLSTELDSAFYFIEEIVAVELCEPPDAET
jgi:hypothetical protein